MLASEHGIVTDAELEQLLEQIQAELERAHRVGSQVVGVFDASGRLKLDARHREMRAEWLKRHDPLVRAAMMGVVVVSHSTLLRGAIMAQNFIRSPPVPTKLANTLEDALAKSAALLEQHGERMPEALARQGSTAF